MPSTKINISVKTKGAIFNYGLHKSAMLQLEMRVQEDIAQEGVRRIREYLSDRFQHQTGHYLSKIQIDRSRPQYRRITDGDIVYGPWLEGTSKRNRATRFKGYHAFRTIQRDLKRDADHIAQPSIDMYVAEMNR